MHKEKFEPFLENISLSVTGFILYSPISILAFPVTVLVANPGASLFTLLLLGILLTALMFLIYLPLTWLDQKVNSRAILLKSLIFIFTSLSIGAIRGTLFYYMVDIANLIAPGDLTNRILASTATTLFWLSAANILINLGRGFRSRYESSLSNFIEQNIDVISSLAPSPQSTTEVEILQDELAKSLANRLREDDSENLQEIAEILKSKINLQLRPLSRRIWLRSLNEYPAMRVKQMLKDAIHFLNFSNRLFLTIMFILALLDNVFIRSFKESLVRTSTFFLLTFAVLLLRKMYLILDNYIYLVAMGVLPVVGSELLSNVFGFNGSWTATALITLVAPAVIIALSVLDLSLRDHKLIIELLNAYDLTQSTSPAKKYDIGERQLASFLHNSLQSEILAVAGQLEDAANSNDRIKSSEILQKVNSLINRSFIDDFHKFSESPLERLNTICNSWKGILDIRVEIPEELLQSQERNLVLVQTIEEFAANSFRHSKATEMVVSGEANEFGLHLTLASNGVRKISKKRGLGSEWLDQIGRSSWNLRTTENGTLLEITI